MITAVCPACGGHIHRSHTRGLGEKLARALTRHRVYRCHHCGWRGWLVKGKAPARRNTVRTIIGLLITLLIALLLAFYFIGKLGSPPGQAN